MKKVFICALAASVSVATVSAQTTTAKPVVKTAIVPAPGKSIMKNLNDSFSYAAGLNIGNSMKEQGISKLNSALVQKAIDDVMNNRTPLLTQEQAGMTLQQQLAEFAKKKSDAEKAKSKAFLDANKKRPGVTTLPNGLQYEVLAAGQANGAKPKPEDTVVVHYVGTLTDGKEFDNSIKRGEPATFPLNGVIKGWTEILQLMPKGAKWKVVIPSDLGYGDRGAGGAIPPGATLVFEIELLDIKPAVKM
jgi:FKBP-type peptidyl-prolyl cis-trans isomerase FklB